VFIRSPNAAFLFSNGSFSDITPNIPGQTVFYRYPNGLNNAGVIVGNYTLGERDVERAFIGSGGNYTTLDVPGSVPGSTAAWAINNAGQILVSSPLGYGLYQPNSGTYLGLNLQALGTTFETFGINNADQIVGEYVDAKGIEHGFVLSDGVLTNLDVPGSQGTYAKGINDLGDIVGYFEDASGNFHAFLATPVPEPSTLLLLAIGTLGVIGWAWRRRRQMGQADGAIS
jgi:probable HAF family extracellular repeat protein